jgi:hypothetical protein
MFEDKITITGTTTLTLYGPDGNVKEQVEAPNLVVTAGKNYIAARMKDAGPTQMVTMRVGTGTTAAAVGQTALVTELASVNLTTAGGTVSGNQVTYQATFPAGTGTGALTEAGVFNAVPTMLCRNVFPVINKGAADTLAITWVITIN